MGRIREKNYLESQICIQVSKRHRIRDPDSQHWYLSARARQSATTAAPGAPPFPSGQSFHPFLWP
jgi:hypothetical protein